MGSIYDILVKGCMNDILVWVVRMTYYIGVGSMKPVLLEICPEMIPTDDGQI